MYLPKKRLPTESVYTNTNNRRVVEGDPASEYNNEWIDAWMKTDNFRIFNKFTDSHIFDIVDPKHPCSGGLTIDDVQRRLAQ